MKRTLKHAAAALLCMAVALPGSTLAEPIDAPDRPTFTNEGVARVPAFELPPSTFMSKEAVDFLKSRASVQMPPPPPPNLSIEQMRGGLERMLASRVQLMRERFPAQIVEEKIGGVSTRIVTPKGGVVDPNRVLINLHGGGFVMCADACALLESLPIASLGGFKVITVNYRMAPEATFPAANEDITAVYREVLKTYKPKQIGIYGCSAGGALSGQMAAWLPRQNLPQPGAIGILGAGAGRFETGDSSHIAPAIDGPLPMPRGVRSYFEGVDQDGPLVSPMMHLDVLKKFPPTLLITGTRAMDLSPAVYTHSQLLKAGANSQLIVAEGMSHCYMYMPQFPESQDAYRTIVAFFRKHLD